MTPHLKMQPNTPKAMRVSRITGLHLITSLAPLAGFCFVLSVFGQGSLTPPGAPGPTMKTLAQIEPRTPISSVPYIITNAGAYYLTTNLSVATGNAITIATNGVTLDLGGFTISSTAPSATGYGVRLNTGLRHITILNGYIQGGVTNNGSGSYSGSGFGYGIYGTSMVNTRVAGVSVSGCLYYGIYLGLVDATVVESCTVRTMGGDGIIAATIKGSTALDCGSQAISGRIVSDSQGESTGDLGGLTATTAFNCFGSSGGGSGLYAYTAQNCSGSSTSGYGLCVTSAHTCSGYSSSSTGIYATSAQNCSGQSASGDGLRAVSALNCNGISSSGYGLYATRTAQNCHGSTTSGDAGLYALDASFCTGSRTGGTAIQATVATGCCAVAGTNNVTYKYNMP
jgi:hypothetical protein